MKKRERLIIVDGLIWKISLDLDHWKELEIKRVPMHLILESMNRYWGDFAKKLWEALHYADWENTAKIIETWSDMIIWHLHLNGFE